MEIKPSESKQGLVSPSLEFTKLQWKDLRKERDIQEASTQLCAAAVAIQVANSKTPKVALETA